MDGFDKEAAEKIFKSAGVEFRPNFVIASYDDFWEGVKRLIQWQIGYKKLEDILKGEK